MKELETSINEVGVSISKTLEKDTLKIMSGRILEATPRMMFFLQQQMKLLQTEKWPEDITSKLYTLRCSFVLNPPADYREIKDNGAMILPSERVLRDYKNYFKPKAGLNAELFHNRVSTGQSLTSSWIQRYMVLVMDEMKIQSNLVQEN